MKRVGTPALSPDGRLVVVPVAEPAYDDKDKTSDLWLVPADGSAAPRQLTFSASAESGVAWSPDSRRIAFSAKREGQDEAQIFVLDIAGGGEAERVTDVADRRLAAALAAGRRGHPVLEHDLSGRGHATRTTRRRSTRRRRASTTRAPTTASRSGTGTAGSTSAARR